VLETGAKVPDVGASDQDGNDVRSTFLAGPGGTIVKVWPRVSVEGHAAAVLEAVRSL
jgi:hypothetical protein